MTPNTDRVPAIVPLSFWKDYDPQPDGSVKEFEWVEWARRGSRNATTREKISRLQKDGGPVWQALEPYYEHWKKGQDAPIEGTPLAAWPGATPALVKALEPYHIRSVEQLAELSDGDMARIPVPGMRGFRDNARAFGEARQATSVVAAQIAQKDREINDLRRELDELRELVSAAGGEPDDDDPKPAPKRRKRKQD